MRLVFIHGINNQGNSSAKIVADWTKHMEAALEAPHLFADIEKAAPFYGDELHRLEGISDPEALVGQGVTHAGREAELFMAEAVLEIAASAGVSQTDILEERGELESQDPVAMGLPPHDRNFIAFVRLIERISPFQGEVALRLLNQAYIYLSQPAVGGAVDAIVSAELKCGQPTVVVAHSLGTVVCFRLLRGLASDAATQREVPLLLTLGSPLAIKSVKKALHKPRAKPAGVGRWLNARDPDDFVTLGEGLDGNTFAHGIDNIGDIVHAPDRDAHSIKGYLSDARVARAVANACGLAVP